MKNGSYALLLTSLALFTSLPATQAQELPENLRFKKLRGTSLVIENCELIQGVDEFVVTRKGSRLTPSDEFDRKGTRLPARYKFFACDSSTESAVLYAKVTKDSEVAQLTFTEDDFPEQEDNGGAGLDSVCPGGTRGVGSGVLYKPAADASDARQGKPAVLLQGSNKTRSSALRIFASNGEEVCKFTFKASSIPGVNGGSDHYFSGWVGGCGQSGSQIAARARSASGSSDIYIEATGGRCLGPVNPTSRVGGVS